MEVRVNGQILQATDTTLQRLLEAHRGQEVAVEVRTVSNVFRLLRLMNLHVKAFVWRRLAGKSVVLFWLV